MQSNWRLDALARLFELIITTWRCVGQVVATDIELQIKNDSSHFLQQINGRLFEVVITRGGHKRRFNWSETCIELVNYNGQQVFWAGGRYWQRVAKKWFKPLTAGGRKCEVVITRGGHKHRFQCSETCIKGPPGLHDQNGHYFEVITPDTEAQGFPTLTLLWTKLNEAHINIAIFLLGIHLNLPTLHISIK